ncbi:MAG: hypothetical protein AAFO07_09360 [Bacteroidota bacterium]
MKYVFIVAVLALSLLGCKERRKSISKQASNISHAAKTNEEIVDKSCTNCDSIYNVFPQDSISFEELYSYPNGLRENEVYKDIDDYFRCLRICYDYSKLMAIVNLGCLIKYDVDGPFYVQDNIKQYLKNNKDTASKLYMDLPCDKFTKHVEFLYAGVENTKFTDELCSWLSSIILKDECKKEVVTEYCLRDFSKYEH